MCVENILAPPVPYSPAGALVPSASASDYDCEMPAGMPWPTAPDSQTSGVFNIRTGNPGQVATVRIGSGLAGNGQIGAL